MTRTVLTTLAAAALASCAQPAPIGMANPASVHCQKVGGKLTIQQTAQGEIGICTLPDGTQIEEWALYRRDHPQR